MSEQRTYKGTIKNTGKTLKQFLDLHKAKIINTDYLQDLEDEENLHTVFYEGLPWDFVEEKYFIVEDENTSSVWEINTLVDLGYDPTYCNLDKDTETGVVTFNTSFHNGGTGLDEMLSDAILEGGYHE